MVCVFVNSYVCVSVLYMWVFYVGNWGVINSCKTRVFAWIFDGLCVCEFVCVCASVMYVWVFYVGICCNYILENNRVCLNIWWSVGLWIRMCVCLCCTCECSMKVTIVITFWKIRVFVWIFDGLWVCVFVCVRICVVWMSVVCMIAFWEKSKSALFHLVLSLPA